ncbi:hypothetical protein JMA_01010 [Jeotgalibacillus malaysiensis]|uniref:Uncharacterized protein n=1 Tax=Jeotgalibacillus malaysiensis TaxID=1508404 RepID=A0A0B5ALN5_9BACL|nr:hypothetical protein JMA_01010 [Jeotgalibacillus malaysiensis]
MEKMSGMKLMAGHSKDGQMKEIWLWLMRFMNFLMKIVYGMKEFRGELWRLK